MSPARGARDGSKRGDPELLSAARDGDPMAFDAFYRRHRDLILAYSAQRTGDPELAADLVGEVFASALLAVRDRARDLPTEPLPWLFVIAQRKIIDSRRRRRVENDARRRLAMEPVVLDDEDLASIVDIAGRTNVALSLASQLPPSQFEALRARVLNELEYSEIAKGSMCSEAVIRKRVSRALHTLRTVMGG